LGKSRECLIQEKSIISLKQTLKTNNRERHKVRQWGLLRIGNNSLMWTNKIKKIKKQ